MTSGKLSRTLAASGLLAGPLLFLFDALIDPAWDGDQATYLQDVSDNSTAYVTGEVAATLGSLLFIAGMIGVMRLMRRRGVTFGYLAAGLVAVGLIGLTGSIAFNAFDLAMADFHDRETMAAFREEFQDSAAYNAYWLVFFLGGVVLGSVMLAVALLRQRIVPIWSPVLLAAASVLRAAAGSERLWTALALLMLVASLAPLAARIWSFRDEEWERWELPR